MLGVLWGDRGWGIFSFCFVFVCCWFFFNFFKHNNLAWRDLNINKFIFIVAVKIVAYLLQAISIHFLIKHVNNYIRSYKDFLYTLFIWLSFALFNIISTKGDSFVFNIYKVSTFTVHLMDKLGMIEENSLMISGFNAYPFNRTNIYIYILNSVLFR